MMTAQKKTSCYTDFLEGTSLRQIASAREVSVRTLERWCSQESWVEKRENHWNEMKQKICSHKLESEISQYMQNGQKLSVLIDFAFQEFQLYMEGKIPKKALKFSTKDFVRLAKSYNLLEERLIINHRQRSSAF
ncbi:MAG: hypothetical protein HQK52_09410 [Oligoflexia bacterium]|nr:hypothetical protein [Oligoflexia bacterium]